MSAPRTDGVVVLRMEKPLTRGNVPQHSAEIVAALEGVSAGGGLCLEVLDPESPDASGLALLLAAAGECRARSVELRLKLPAAFSEFAEDLRLAKHLVVENPEGPK